MKKTITILLLFLFTIVTFSYGQGKKTDLDREHIKGKVKYMNVKTSSSDNKDGEFATYKFNENGYKMFVINYVRSFTKTYNYDAKDQMIEIKEYPNGSKEKTINVYNKFGNIIETKVFDVNEVCNSIVDNNYDAKGNVNKSEMFAYIDGERQLYATATYDYNDKGQLIQANFDFIIYSNQTAYKYNDKGSLIEEIKSGLDSDEYGDIFDLNDITTYTYKYDNRGNEIEQTIYDQDKKITNVITKKLVYYGDKDENNYPQWDKKMK